MFFVKEILRRLCLCREGDRRAQKGFINIYVGKEGEQLKKFTIPLRYLSSPTFRAMLERSMEEYGERVCGPIKIPCEIEVFERGLKLVKAKENEKKFKELSYDEHLWPASRFVAAVYREWSSSEMSLSGGRMRYSCSAGAY